MDYQPFAISNFRVGFNESVEPWLLPRDAYQSVINAHLYRGVIEKIEGYNLFANFSNRTMLSLGTPDGVTTYFTGFLATLPVSNNFVIYGTIVAGTSAETFTYASESASVVTLAGSAGGQATVNMLTGKYDITFNTAPPSNTYSCCFIIWDSLPASDSAIMGIKQYYNSNSSKEVLVFNQKRVGTITSTSGAASVNADGLQYVKEIPHDYYQSALFTGNGAVATYTSGINATALTTLIVPGTVIFTEFTSAGVIGRTWIDDGVGRITGTGLTSGSVNYVTGAYTLTFAANISSGNYISSAIGKYGDLFTGTISNFFSLTNYQYKAFFCNNVDPIFYYDGTQVRYLNTNLTSKVVTASSGVPAYDITRCLHVFVNRERLLLISPRVSGINKVSSIYWSTAGNPLVFTNNDSLEASTSEPIKTIGFINSDLVVRFSNSERVFRYTQDAFSPFRWDSTNNIWACDASYSAINYDSWFSSVGKPAIVGSDAVNVKRVDEIIPDFTDPSRLSQQFPVPFINQNSIQQCYGERFDDLKEGWLCYNSSPDDQTAVTASDNVLAFNYLDGTYAIYQFPFSCLGFGIIDNVPTWGSIYTTWENMGDTWGSFQLTKNSLIDLAGDQFNKVYQLNSGNSLGDGTTPVKMSVITKNFNPFIEQGELCRFGYMDILVSADQSTKLRVQLYINDQLYVDNNGEPAGYYQENTLTFTPTDSMSPTTDQTKVWKRIYSGAVGKDHTIRFYQHEDDFDDTLDQPVWIHAMVLYMKPAGRIFS